ncbi:Primase C terminal 1 (PriCT-1) [Caldanaerobius fijiensis DSM 17918]|uniref:Primase C terminal 1 (PriCT-1) n=1 Tax=Caldanaerobius fijiensis DSM 17918 TaxID=1121256 RepID=A0A1M5F097_9THEO|nr:AAA family ATPase [Caldanaerobius fijiensis]SHF84807.1 Primase C terminal 1 (PriCT-1) [Caldanaerobius fijiensis DSM 17918]
MVTEIVKVLIQYMPYCKGNRHQTCFALAGWLRKKGYTKEEVEETVKALALHFNDEDVADRLLAVESTFSQDLENVSGWSSLVEIIGKEAAHDIETRIPTIYTYTNVDGTPLFRILRYDRPEGKTFQTEHFDGKTWQKGLNGTAKVLYNLPRLKEAITGGETIFVVEGEKCVHALEKLGLTATTNPFGAGSWIDEYAEQLKDAKNVIILPDNDEAGHKHAQKVEESLKKYGINARIVGIPNLGEGEDVADLIAREEIDREWLLKSINTPVQPLILPVIPLVEALEKELTKNNGNWRIEKLLPESGLTLLAARPKLGKTEVLLKIGASILMGENCFGRRTQQGRILWITSEDSSKRIYEGLTLYQAPHEVIARNVFTLDQSQVSSLLDADKIIETAKQLKVQTVIIEPLAALKEIGNLGMKNRLNYETLYSAMLPILRKAKNAGVLIVGVWHSVKGKAYLKDVADAVDAPLGSTAYTAIADSIVAIGLPPNATGWTERRVMAVGRDVTLDITLRWDGTHYVEAFTAPNEIMLITPERKAVLNAILELHEKATPTNIAQYLNKSSTAVRVALSRLHADALVARSEKGYVLTELGYTALGYRETSETTVTSPSKPGVERF